MKKLLIAVLLLSGCASGKWTVDSSCTTATKLCELADVVCEANVSTNSKVCVKATEICKDAGVLCGRLEE